MAVEHYSTSLTSRLAISGTMPVAKGYYRSKLFIAPTSTNTLVGAAGPLLSLLERLCLSMSLPPIEQIRENIQHELHAFHSKMDAAKYPTDITQIAHYLLLATIDELLGKNYLRLYNTPAEFKAFTPLTVDDAQPQERFFEIVHYIQERPNQYLDLIELCYYCLIVGFEGAYHLKPDGRQSLDNIIEHLYQMIQQHRCNKPHRLFNDNPIPKSFKKDNKTTLIAAAVALSVLVGAFWTSHLVLESKAKKVLFQNTQLSMLDK